MQSKIMEKRTNINLKNYKALLGAFFIIQFMLKSPYYGIKTTFIIRNPISILGIL